MSPNTRKRLLGGAVAAVTASLLLSGVAQAHWEHQSLQARLFLVNADAVRTAIAAYYQRQSLAGAPQLPRSLSDLGADALPVDPWTGRADWAPVRDAQGAVIGVYSRSQHAVEDPEELAELAVLRPGLDAVERARAGISAWQFVWQPPAPQSAHSAPLPDARQALQGRWPSAGGQRLVLSTEDAGLPAVRPNAGATPRRGAVRRLARRHGQMLVHRAARQHPAAPLLTLAAASTPVQRAVAPVDPTLLPAWSVYVPMTTADATVGAPPEALVGTPPAPPPVDPAVLAKAEEEPEMPLSEDPRERRCQISLGRDPKLKCAPVRNTIDGEAGFDACVAKWNDDLQACVDAHSRT